MWTSIAEDLSTCWLRSRIPTLTARSISLGDIPELVIMVISWMKWSHCWGEWSYRTIVSAEEGLNTTSRRRQSLCSAIARASAKPTIPSRVTYLGTTSRAIQQSIGPMRAIRHPIQHQMQYLLKNCLKKLTISLLLINILLLIIMNTLYNEINNRINQLSLFFSLFFSYFY